jgi:hypothetical protein
MWRTSSSWSHYRLSCLHCHRFRYKTDGRTIRFTLHHQSTIFSCVFACTSHPYQVCAFKISCEGNYVSFSVSHLFICYTCQALPWQWHCHLSCTAFVLFCSNVVIVLLMPEGRGIESRWGEYLQYIKIVFWTTDQGSIKGMPLKSKVFMTFTVLLIL